jgi:hypothetical protein
MKNLFVTMVVVAVTFTSIATAQTYLGNLSANPFLPKAPPQPRVYGILCKRGCDQSLGILPSN